MRITIDSADYDAIAGYRWDFKIGYYNGPGAWTREQIGDAAARGELLALVDAEGTAPYAASILDWKRGKIQSPELLHDWVAARNLFRGDAAVYCSREQLTDVINALQGEPCRIWLADPTGDHEPPRQPPPLGLPASLTLLGIQYATPPDSGGDYDISVLYDDAWHSTEIHHEDLAAVAAGDPGLPLDQMLAGPAAAARPLTAGEQNLANLEAHWAREETEATAGKAPAAATSPSTAVAPVPTAPAASASTPTDSPAWPPTGARMMNPDPQLSSPQAAGSATSSMSSAVPPRPVPAAALSRPPAAAPAPSSSSPGRPSTQPSGFSIPPGLLHPPIAAGPDVPAQPVPATSPSADTGLSAAPATGSASNPYPGGTQASGTPPLLQLLELGDGPPPTTPAAPAPAAGPPASLMPHDWIQTVLADMRQAATWFRAAGVHHPARLLEEAAATAAEAGSLLMRAGL